MLSRLLHKIDAFNRKALWITGPSALAILVGLALNAGLQDDGVVIGHPRTVIVHVQQQPEGALSMAALQVSQRALSHK